MGSNPDRRDGNLATNRLIYGAALKILEQIKNIIKNSTAWREIRDSFC
jgi:hypothetical protein